MASLPSNTFMFNYNAREYDSSTYTFPKTEGQLFDEDLVLNRAPSSYGEDYVFFGSSSAYMGKTYSSNSSNPMNRNSSNTTFTFVYKTSGFTSGDYNLFANRANNYNYMVRGNMFHTSSSGFLSLTPSSNPQIVFIRVNSDGSAERKVVDTSGNVLQSVSASSISWGSVSNGFGFFAGYASGGELFQDYFYWMYCSLEALTDAEILRVIQYNENTSVFETDITGITSTYQSSTTAITLTTNEETSWTATTIPSWVSLSPSSGVGSSSISVTILKNNSYSQRTGTIVLTSSEGNTAEIACAQDKHPILVPKNNIYREGRLIN